MSVKEINKKYRIFHQLPNICYVTNEKTEEYLESLFKDYYKSKEEYCDSTKHLFPNVEIPDQTVKLNCDTESVDCIVKKSYESGVLKLKDKKLKEIPEEVWGINIQNDRQSVYSGKNINSKTKEIEGQSSKSKPLTYLDLSNNSIQSFCPKGPALFTLKELHINGCWLSVLPEDAVKFKSLKVLSVEDNGLTILPPTISNLIHLVQLNVSKNYIEELPRDLKRLVNLKKLNISHNFIAVIPYEIVHLKMLEELDLSYNKLYSIPEEIQKISSLKILNISNNYITNLPKLSFMYSLNKFIGNDNDISEFPNFYSCRKLTEIQMEGNKLSEFAINNLHAVPVKKLCLQNNQLTVLPNDIDRLSSLNYLDVSKNNLYTLPWRLSLVKKLSVLKVQNNPIKDINPQLLKSTSKTLMCLMKKALQFKEIEIVGKSLSLNRDLSLNDKIDKSDIKSGELVLKKLSLYDLTNKDIKKAKEENINKIDLSKNNFIYVPQKLQQLSSILTEIVLKHNNLKALPDFIGKMIYLMHLDVSHNRLETLPISMRTCLLRTLIAEYNNFQSIPRVVYLIKSLKSINFHENKINKIDINGLKNLTNLISLDLGNNYIQKVPSELGYLKNIEELHLYGNLFKYPQISVLNEGTNAVMKYLRENINKDESKYLVG